MSHGEGARRVCPECGQSVYGLKEHLSHRELRGPRNITSSNVDRIFDDGGKRFLVIEEKRDLEKPLAKGQQSLLVALSKVPQFTVWLARGNPDYITITDFAGEPWPFIQGIDFDGYQTQVERWFLRDVRDVAS